jgi:hypothetical protein
MIAASLFSFFHLDKFSIIVKKQKKIITFYWCFFPCIITTNPLRRCPLRRCVKQICILAETRCAVVRCVVA